MTFRLRLAGIMLVAALAPGAAAAETPDRASLLGLAQQFVDRVGGGFAEADKALAKIQPKDKSAEIKRYFDNLEDGEILLMQMQFGKLQIEQPVTGEKRGQDVMVSLGDFVTAARLAIRVLPQDKKAEGWYIRENQIFVLDAAAGTVTANGREFRIAEGDVDVREDDIYVRGQALASWFDFDLTVNPMIQTFDIVSEQKWPPEERAERLKRAQAGRYRLPPPQQPRYEEPYKPFEMPNLDVSTRQNYNRRGNGGGGDSTNSQTADSSHTVRFAGDLAGHTGTGFITGTNTDNVRSFRLTLDRKSDEPDLLGPLKARSYEFNDITTVSVPLAGSAANEMGFRISNKNPYVTSDTVTEITGDSLPGWDVEIYRNDSYQESAVVDENGRYRFADVLLFAGKNDFTIVQYGPQGETREEKRTITVQPRLYGVEGGAYDVSLTSQNTQTWRRNPSEDTDKATPHLAATYEYPVGQDWTLRTGVRARQENDEDKIYSYSGAVGVVGNTVVNADFANDEDGAYAAALTARRKLGQHDLSASASYDSENYDPGNSDYRPGEYSTSISVRGPLTPGEMTPSGRRRRSDHNYSASYDYTARENDTGERNASFKISSKIGKLRWGNGLTDSVSWEGDEDTERLRGALTLSGKVLGNSVRGAMSYGLYPESKINSYALNIQKYLNPNLDAELAIEYEPHDDYTLAELGLNWAAPYLTFSPSFTYDSENALGAIFRTQFSTSRNPATGDAVMRGLSLGTKGGIAARVFLDRNGDNAFGEGDELLEGVTVEALHARRSAETDVNGEAFVINIPTNRITDVIVQDGSMFDPLWVSGVPGYSIRPRAGHSYRLEFPIHIGGEMDGVIYARRPDGKGRPLRNMKIYLYNADARKVATAETGIDGFYLFSRIHPGHYLMMIDAQDAADSRVARPPPQEIKFGYEGTTIYGNDLYLDPAGADIPVDIPVDILADLGDYEDMNEKLNRAALAGQSVVLNLGSYNSRLLTALTWYRLRTRYGPVVGVGTVLVPPSTSFASIETGLHTLRVRLPDYDVQNAWRRCQSLAARGFYCGIEILPKGLAAVPDGEPLLEDGHDKLGAAADAGGPT